MSDIDSKKIRNILFNKYDGKCAYCGCKLSKSFSIDHIVPKWRNCDKKYKIKDIGSDSIDNLNPCCASCNSSKSTLSIEEWRNQIYLKWNNALKECSSLRLLSRYNMVKYTPNFKFYFEKYGRLD